MKIPSLAFLFLLTLSGCLATAPVSTTRDLAGWEWVTRAGNWPGPDEYRLNLVTFQDGHNQQTHLVRFDVFLTRQRLLMAAQTTLGLPLYEILLEDGRLTVTYQMDRLKELPVERALADFLLSTWPLQQLQAALTPAGYTVRESGSDRLLVDPSGVRAVEVHTITKANETTVQIVHHDIPLQITVRTLEREISP